MERPSQKKYRLSPKGKAHRNFLQKGYNQRHREQILEKNRERYQANKETIAAQKKEFRRIHAARIKEQRRIGRQKNAARIRAQRALRRQRPRDKALAYARNQAYRARCQGAAVSDFTLQQWIAMQELADHRCAYCHKRRKGKLERDHIQPLSKGGNHTWSNIVPACRSCNAQKNAGPLPSPVQPALNLVI